MIGDRERMAATIGLSVGLWASGLAPGLRARSVTGPRKRTKTPAQKKRDKARKAQRIARRITRHAR